MNKTALAEGGRLSLEDPQVADDGQAHARFDGVVLSPSASVANPTFDAPTVSANNTFLFTLNVTGCNGQKAAASWR
jgi:hypothetical protein